MKFHKQLDVWVIFKATLANNPTEYARLKEYMNDPDIVPEQTAVTGDRQVMWLKLMPSASPPPLIRDENYVVTFEMQDGVAQALTISQPWVVLDN